MNKENTELARVLRYVILATQRQGNRRLSDLLRRYGLTPAQAEALEVLSEHGPMTTREVGQYLLCESGSPSRILGALADKGLSIRSRPEGDKRATLHSLTREGRDRIQAVQQAETEFNNEFARILQTQFPTSDAVNDLATRFSRLVTDPALLAALQRRFPELDAGELVTDGPTEAR